MTTAPVGGGEAKRKKRRRRRPKGPTPPNLNNSPTSQSKPVAKKAAPKRPYAKRVDEISAGGLVIDSTGTKGL
jgi:hypothetical protein